MDRTGVGPASMPHLMLLLALVGRVVKEFWVNTLLSKPCLAVQPGGVPCSRCRGGCSRHCCIWPHHSRGGERFPYGCGQLLGRAGRAASSSYVQPTLAQPSPQHCCFSLLNCWVVLGCFRATWKCSSGWQEREKAAWVSQRSFSAPSLGIGNQKEQRKPR